jgi:hypothetical protein
VLTADTALAPSLIPSIHIALADPHGRRAMEYVPLLAQPHEGFQGSMSPWNQHGHRQVDLPSQA